MDFSKSQIADARHRILLHHAGGCFLVEMAFGVTRKNSAGKVYSTRDIAEQHIIEDLGFIPSFQDYIDADGGGNLQLTDWMSGSKKINLLPVD